MENTSCTETRIHCSNCGSTNQEEVGFEVRQRNEGYSDCCNEPVEWGARDCRNHHSH
jgi:hypothetical protein